MGSGGGGDAAALRHGTGILIGRSHGPYLMPRGEDRSVENGSTLTRVGRSHALALWEAMESAHTKGDRIHTAVDISANTQVVAMVANSTNPFVEDDAIRGANMLFLAGSDLQHILLDGGLLYATRCNDGVERLCTSTARVRATFENLCYVIISKDSTYYKNCSFGPVCTCQWFCRYARCEHLTFVRHLGLRLLPADWVPSTVPSTQKHGRSVTTIKRTAKKVQKDKPPKKPKVSRKLKTRKKGAQ